MSMKKTYSVIGGDLRSLKLAESLLKENNCVKIFGFNNAEVISGLIELDHLKATIEGSDVVVGPMPLTSDGETVNAVFSTNKIYLEEIFSFMKEEQLFVAGLIPDKIKNIIQEKKISVKDLLDREEMAVLNAIPSAEGAIQIAMEELPITLHNANTLVLGFGRIGKVLSKMLQGIGANVFVEARKYSDLAWIQSYGYKAINIKNLNDWLRDFDVIFNTIPSMMLDQNELNLLKKDCLLIDLASKPGGINFEKAKENGIKAIWALALPGKVAPISAALFMKGTIYNILNELDG